MIARGSRVRSYPETKPMLNMVSCYTLSGCMACQGFLVVLACTFEERPSAMPEDEPGGPLDMLGGRPFFCGV